MDVLKGGGLYRKVVLILAGIGVAMGLMVAAPTVVPQMLPTASACGQYNDCGGGYDQYDSDRGYYRDRDRHDRDRCPDWQEWRNDNPGDPYGGCADRNQHYNIWIKHSGWNGYTWYLDTPGPGLWNGLDLGPDCNYGDVNYYQQYGGGRNVLTVLVTPGGGFYLGLG